MDNSKQATLELGTKPVGKLLMQYALPAIAAMTAASLYNMTDSIFIGQGCGALAISGLAITFPLQNLGAAFGAGVGVGASTCISVRLGQKDYDTAERVFGNAVTLNLIIGVAFSIITLLFLNPILMFFGASEATLPLRTRVYGYNTCRQRYISHVLWHERHTACRLQASFGNDGIYNDRYSQCHTFTYLYMAFAHGHWRSSLGHHHSSV